MNPLNILYMVIALGILWPMVDFVMLDRWEGVSECQSLASHQQRNQCLFDELEKEQQRADIARSIFR